MVVLSDLCDATSELSPGLVAGTEVWLRQIMAVMASRVVGLELHQGVLIKDQATQLGLILEPRHHARYVVSLKLKVVPEVFRFDSKDEPIKPKLVVPMH